MVCEIISLCNRLHHGPHDPVECKQQLLEGVARLTGSDFGLCAISSDGDFSEPVLKVSVMSLHGARSKRVAYRRPTTSVTQRMLESLNETLKPVAGSKKAAIGNGAREIVSTVSLNGNGTLAALVLNRRPKRAAFSAQERAFVELFHEQMRWIYKIDLPLASQEVLSLSSRPRQTLQYLLAGFSEKQTAAALGLSTNTVHHYVKHLYKHFGVSSRSELLSRWVRE
jgi:DNA-binding CsgD family transcriptional regulator